MSDNPNTIWFRIGYAMERGRRDPPMRGLRSLEERLRGPGAAVSNDRHNASARQTTGRRVEPLEALLTAAAGAVAGKLFGRRGRGRPGLLRLLRAGAAGAAAALVREALDPLLSGDAAGAEGRDLTEAVLSGTARGLVYGALLEPRLLGSPPFRGLVYGSVEYVFSPLGGIGGVLAHRLPHRRLPGVAELLEERPLGRDTYLDHVVFGVTLALLYGSSRSGTTGET